MLSHLAATLHNRSQAKRTKKANRKQIAQAVAAAAAEMSSPHHSISRHQHHRPPSSAGSSVSHISTTSTATGTVSMSAAGGGHGGNAHVAGVGLQQQQQQHQPPPPPVPPKRKSSQPPTSGGLTPSSSLSLSGIAKSVSTVEVAVGGPPAAGGGGGGVVAGSGAGTGGGSGSGAGGPVGGSGVNSSAVSVSGRTQPSLSATNRETAAGATTRANAWQALCTKVLPLFNGQGLRGHMEDMNDLVSTWLGESYSVQAINEDLHELLTTGLLTLSTKLAAVNDEGLANRIVEVWSFFFTTVVPYLQGVFLPLRTQWRLGGPTSVSSDANDPPPDVRMLTLCGFRDQILLPLAGRMGECFPRLSADIENGRKVNDTASRLMQMLCIASGLPGPVDKQRLVGNLLLDFKQTMMGSLKEKEAGANRNSMALYGSRVHASS
ncbi:hypothetical protein HDU86_005739 [Geranomyces michiganensis]|nr:hypothetical protein HDU86_005739 [Geranomyces michiganensis]